jgi:phosphoketolase
MVRPRLGRQQREFAVLFANSTPVSSLIRFRAWHAIKYLDPRESGAVIPILHANGFKISERTIFGCMDDKEIVSLFSGYGYQVCIVEDLDNIDDQLQSALEWAVAEIKKIQQAARSGKPIAKPRWPMLVLRTPKVNGFLFSPMMFVVRDTDGTRVGRAPRK